MRAIRVGVLLTLAFVWLVQPAHAQSMKDRRAAQNQTAQPAQPASSPAGSGRLYLDKNGNAVDENGNPVHFENGNPVYENGQPTKLGQSATGSAGTLKPAQNVLGGIASASVAVLAGFPQCEGSLSLIKPLIPFLDQDVGLSMQNADFRRQMIGFAALQEAFTPCMRAVAASKGDTKPAAAILATQYVLQDFRANVLAWLVDQLSRQNRALVNYTKESQQYVHSLRIYAQRLQLYARQVQGQQEFLQTLELLRALNPPAAPRVYIPESPQLTPALNLGVHCTVQPTITGQTFVDCY